jgi:hypothetical protein
MKTIDKPKEQTKADVFAAEYGKLTKLFESVEESKRKLVEGLINDAAFLCAENFELRKLLEKTGMVICRPQHPEQQRPIEAARQYRQNISSYAVIIKTLNGILSHDQQELDDDFDDFVNQHAGGTSDA